VRASDRDREQVVELLREHYSAGRLSDDEFDVRTEGAYGARTLGELDALTLDLPSADVALPAREKSSAAERELIPVGRGLWLSVRIHLTVYAIVNVMLIGIWAASGGGYFWPIWPLMGWGSASARTPRR
jgi:hypothetical protein